MEEIHNGPRIKSELSCTHQCQGRHHISIRSERARERETYMAGEDKVPCVVYMFMCVFMYSRCIHVCVFMCMYTRVCLRDDIHVGCKRERARIHPHVYDKNTCVYMTEKKNIKRS